MYVYITLPPLHSLHSRSKVVSPLPYKPPLQKIYLFMHYFHEGPLPLPPQELLSIENEARIPKLLPRRGVDVDSKPAKALRELLLCRRVERRDR